MDDERFDAFVRVLGTGSTRRGVLGALAGAAGLHLSDTDARRKRGGKNRNRKRGEAKGRVGAEVAVNACANLCALIFPRPGRPRNRCLQRAAANQVVCECVSFCRRVYPGDLRAQLACLRAAVEGEPESVCLACGADPDFACPQPAGGHICCSAGQSCQSGICGSGDGGDGGNGGDGGDGGEAGGCVETCDPVVRQCGVLDRSGCGLEPLNCGNCGPGQYCNEGFGSCKLCCDLPGPGCSNVPQTCLPIFFPPPGGGVPGGGDPNPNCGAAGCGGPAGPGPGGPGTSGGSGSTAGGPGGAAPGSGSGT
jgi:hypothetical protein